LAFCAFFHTFRTGRKKKKKERKKVDKMSNPSRQNNNEYHLNNRYSNNNNQHGYIQTNHSSNLIDQNNLNQQRASENYMYQQQEQQHQQRQNLPGGPPSANRMPQPARPSNGVTLNYLQPSPYQRGSANINRSKSLTRPERQRPRPGMINASNNLGAGGPSQRRTSGLNRRKTANNGNNGNGDGNGGIPRNAHNQPMSNNLQMQLAQQKQQQQMNNGAIPLASNMSDLSEQDEEKEPSPLNNWWAWIAFLCTCCYPSYIIRVWFGKSNKNMQQAWREKVCSITKSSLYEINSFKINLGYIVLLGWLFVWFISIHYLWFEY
jgi:chitin synthase